MTAAIPLTIIGGYLGAGKTTLLNMLLRGNHGKRLAVIVNDFGSINIDAELIANRDGETLSLTNGCICCSMTDDLATTLIALSDRETPPDHILIETSGVAEPQKIATYADALPAFQLQAVVVVVDAETIRKRSKDKFVGGLVTRQIASADLIVMSKLDLLTPSSGDEIRQEVAKISAAPIVASHDAALQENILVGSDDRRHATIEAENESSHDHTHGSQFAQWCFTSDMLLDREWLLSMIEARPRGVYRIKGILSLADEPTRRQTLQVVGRRVSIDAGTVWGDDQPTTRIVAIGARGDEDAARWAADCERGFRVQGRAERIA